MNNNVNVNEILQKAINHIKKNEHHDIDMTNQINTTQQVENMYGNEDSEPLAEPQAPVYSYDNMPHGGLVGIHILSPDTAIRVYDDGYKVIYNITNNTLVELSKISFDNEQNKSIHNL